MAGKNINLKVKDLITTKFSSVPKDQIGKRTVKKKPKIVVKPIIKTEERKEKPVAPPISKRLSQLPRPAKAVLGGNKSLNVSSNSLEESKASPSGSTQGGSNNKSFKKFIRKGKFYFSKFLDKQKKTFVKPTSLSQSMKKPTKAPKMLIKKEEEDSE